MRIRRGPPGLLGLALAFGALTVVAGPAGGGAIGFFRNHAGLSDADLADLLRGRPVTRTLETRDSRHIAAFGAILVRADRHALVRAFHDIEVFKRSDIVLEIGKFSEPPRLDDLHGLSLDRQVFDDLRKCRPGSCGVRLGAEDMARLQAAAEPRTEEAYARTAGLVRAMLFARLQAYRRGGDAALAPYADKQPPVELGEHFTTLLQETRALADYAPDLVNYVRTYPSNRPAGSQEFFYWSKEKFGLKPVVSLTHVVIHEQRLGAASVIAIISKQLYASHYFDASLGSSLLFDDEKKRGERFYLVYLNRSRNVTLGGFFGAFVRPIVRGRVRDGMSEHLLSVRARIESRTAGGEPNPLPGAAQR